MASRSPRPDGPTSPAPGRGGDRVRVETDAGRSVWRFERQPKIGPTCARIEPPERTKARVDSIRGRVPITRVSDLTPLDRLRLPVVTAITPLARDLTTHMGKGPDLVAAQVSALMEAIERVSAEEVAPHRRVGGSLEHLMAASPVPPLDPRDFELPDDTAYEPRRQLTWIRSLELNSESEVLMPADLVLTPPSEGVLHEVDTNGLAAGNSHLEALVHALCEAIERDAISQLEFVALFADPGEPRLPVRRIDPASAPPPSAGWIDRLRSEGLGVAVQEIATDIPVPVFRALVVEPDYPAVGGSRPLRFLGWGSAPSAEEALLRSLTEAVQARLAFIQGARDSFNRATIGARAATRLDNLMQLAAAPQVPFSAVPSHPADDLLADLRFLLRSLAAAGFDRVVATDLTREDLGVPVVRVRIPGLSSFYVNRRRVGWRCLRHLI